MTEIALNDDKLYVRMTPPISPEEMVENMRSALSRGLPEIKFCAPRGYTLAIASGGPSLQDTYTQLEGHIAAVNGSLGFLLDRGIVPEFCGVLDANPHMADIVVADPRVRYLVASNCHPTLFDKLLGAGCRVWLWHTTGRSLGTPEADDVLRKARPDTWISVYGGSTIGLRLVNLGHVLGYRKFHLHGMDSSFRDDKTHAYPDRRDGDWINHHGLEVNGYRTSLNFLQQVSDFANLLTRFSRGDIEPIEIEMFGEGLLQSCYRYWLEHKDHMSPDEAFQQW